jgi:hypothetical protein
MFVAIYTPLSLYSDAVDVLVEKRLAKTRKEAVELGRNLARELGLFHHVTGDHAFCDDYLFFRFSDAANNHSYTFGENPFLAVTDKVHEGWSNTDQETI